MEGVEQPECPFCFDRMRFEDRAGVAWLVCPNGCPTEIEAPEPKPAGAEADEAPAEVRPRTAGAA